MKENMKLASMLARERQRDPVKRGRVSAYRRCVCGKVINMDSLYYYKSRFYCKDCIGHEAIQIPGTEATEEAGREQAK